MPPTSDPTTSLLCLLAIASSLQAPNLVCIALDVFKPCLFSRPKHTKAKLKYGQIRAMPKCDQNYVVWLVVMPKCREYTERIDSLY
jgi:hypothetical protein